MQTKLCLTYALLQVPLYNTELSRVDGILHDEPAESLLVLGVNLAGLNKLRLELGDALLVCLRTQVDNDCVDHDMWMH